MSLTLGWVLLNTAYLLYASSGLFKDMLPLRIMWMTSTVFFLAHGLVDQLWPAVWWNIPVLCIHLWMVSDLIRQRRGIDLDDEAEAIQILLFPDLDRVAFNTMWHCGTEIEIVDKVIITKGKPVSELTMIMDGEVDVEVNDELIVRLSQYRLVGEMSSLSGNVATASVTALGTVRARVWDKKALAECGKKYPQIQLALLQAMGNEVTRKLS